MSKQKTVYTCSFCGYQSPKWLGKCPDCDQWNTFYEDIALSKSSSQLISGVTSPDSRPQLISEIQVDHEDRISTGIE